MQSLPYALPAAAAGLAYLNGRHAFTYDRPFLTGLMGNIVAAIRHNRHDDINHFYILERQAESSRGSHPWIVCNGRSWTYAEAYETVLKYGVWLTSKGVQKNDVVAMDFVNSELFVWVWFGLWSIGAKPAFINYNLTGKPLLHCIKTSTARIVLVGETGRDKYADDVMAEHGFVKPQGGAMPKARQATYKFDSDVNMIPRSIRAQTQVSTNQNQSRTQTEPTEPNRRKLEIIFFDKSLEDHIASLEPVRLPNSARSGQKLNDMAILIFTSGTTGMPKPGIMAFGKANLGGKYVSHVVPFTKKDILYTSMPLYHGSGAIFGLCAVLHGGATVCLGKKFSHKVFWPEVRSSKATVILYVGETCRYLLNAPKSPIDKDHNVRIAMGNGLRPDVWDAFKERFNIPTILEFYAATEAPSAMFNRSSNSFSAGAVGRHGLLSSFLIGSALTITKIEPGSDPPEPVREPSGLCKIAGHNEPGELLYQLNPADTSQRYQGYFGNEKATNSKILRDVKKKGDVYFRTGDLMRRDSEGRWYFVDRIGDTFRWKAENVSTAEVSETVGKHVAVEEAAVYGVQIPQHDGRAGCAALVLKNSDSASRNGALPLPRPQTLKSLADHSMKSLPAFAVPVFLRVTRAMHTTGTNKQQKHVFQKGGIDVEQIEKEGDALFWLRGGTYERFTKRDLDRIRGDLVKL